MQSNAFALYALAESGTIQVYSSAEDQPRVAAGKDLLYHANV